MEEAIKGKIVAKVPCGPRTLIVSVDPASGDRKWPLAYIYNQSVSNPRIYFSASAKRKDIPAIVNALHGALAELEALERESRSGESVLPSHQPGVPRGATTPEAR